MAYAQCFIIGMILIVSAYDIYASTSQRHHFHLFMAWITNIRTTTMEDYEYFEFYRIIWTAFIFTSGLSLVCDFGKIPAIASQTFLIILSILDKTKNTILNSLHWIMLNITILIILIINRQMSIQSTEAEQTIKRSILITKKIKRQIKA